MKTILTFVVFVLCINFAQSQTIENEKLAGAWALAVFKYTLPDTVISGNSKMFNSVKIFSNKYFSYVGKSLPDHIFKRAGGGRFELVGDQLTEVYDFSSIGNMLGKTFTFKCKIEGDTYYHTGQINDIFVEEVWKKLE
jgi:hypothetical protein